MLKLTKTGIGLLTKQYKSVLRKCWAINVRLFATTAILTTMMSKISEALDIGVFLYPETTNSAMTSPGWDAQDLTVRNYQAISFAAFYDNNYRHQTIKGSLSIAANLELLDAVIGSFPIYAGYGLSNNINRQVVISSKENNSVFNTLDSAAPVMHNLAYLDYVIGELKSGTYIGTKNIGDNLKALDTQLKTVSDNYITKSVNDLNNYYTKSETYSRDEIANLDSLNYYYTFRVDERTEVIDSASFFQKYFSTLQEVDLQSKNPTHLGAFTKCDEVCPRPSERFVSPLSQEQMLKNNASVDAGTSRHCLRQFGDVVADLLKNTVAKSLRISEFMNEEVCHA